MNDCMYICWPYREDIIWVPMGLHLDRILVVISDVHGGNASHVKGGQHLVVVYAERSQARDMFLFYHTCFARSSLPLKTYYGTYTGKNQLIY